MAGNPYVAFNPLLIKRRSGASYAQVLKLVAHIRFFMETALSGLAAARYTISVIRVR